MRQQKLSILQLFSKFTQITIKNFLHKSDIALSKFLKNTKTKEHLMVRVLISLTLFFQ